MNTAATSRAKPDISGEMLRKYPFLNRPYALAVARIQTDNNPELLLYAFNQAPEAEFVFIGNWKRSEYGRELKQRYEVYPTCTCWMPSTTLAELNVIRANCAYYVHGHSAGRHQPVPGGGDAPVPAHRGLRRGLQPGHHGKPGRAISATWPPWSG